MPETTDSMVRVLAEAPEEQRREMVKTRLASFADMSGPERVDAMRMMLNSAQKLDSKGKEKLAYTRLESLAEDFDEKTRKKLLQAHMQALMDAPQSQMTADMNSMASAAGRCHDSCRMKVMKNMKEIMGELPDEKRKSMAKNLPQQLQKMLM